MNKNISAENLSAKLRIEECIYIVGKTITVCCDWLRYWGVNGRVTYSLLLGHFITMLTLLQTLNDPHNP